MSLGTPRAGDAAEPSPGSSRAGPPPHLTPRATRCSRPPTTLIIMGLTAAPPVVASVPAPHRTRSAGQPIWRAPRWPSRRRAPAEHAVVLSLLTAAASPPARAQSKAWRARRRRGPRRGRSRRVIGDPWATRLAESGARWRLPTSGAGAPRVARSRPCMPSLFVGVRTPRASADLEPFVRAVAMALRRLAEATRPRWRAAAGQTLSAVRRTSRPSSSVVRTLSADGRVDPGPNGEQPVARVRERWPIPVAVEASLEAADLLWRSQVIPGGPPRPSIAASSRPQTHHIAQTPIHVRHERPPSPCTRRRRPVSSGLPARHVRSMSSSE